jgi:two-component system LytT family sensor kinase
MKLLIEAIKFNFWYKIVLGCIIGLLSIKTEMYGVCPADVYVIDFLCNVFGCFMIWTGSDFITKSLDQKYSWQFEPVKRSIMMIVWNIIFILISLLILMEVLSLIIGKQFNWNFYLISVVSTVFITLIINLIFIINDLYKFWNISMYEAEVLRKENMRSQLETLKNQVNPHFLFNSLNTLVSVIDEDTKTAKEFVLKLSQVYRYSLQNREKDVVKICEELNFLSAYNYLLAIRYGDNLHFRIDVPENIKSGGIPSLVLQILVENCIKHNVISTDKPLLIEIYTEQNALIVRNNYQPKKIKVESEKIGLENTMNRYKLLGEKEIEVLQTNEYFTVKLPVIDINP